MSRLCTLTDKQRVFIRQQLAANRHIHFCNVCNQKLIYEFDVLDYDTWKGESTGKRLSFVHLSCPACGFVVSFNGVTLGVADPKTGELLDK